MKKDEPNSNVMLKPFLYGAGAVIAGVLIDRMTRGISINGLRGVLGALLEAKLHWRSIDRETLAKPSEEDEDQPTPFQDVQMDLVPPPQANMDGIPQRMTVQDLERLERQRPTIIDGDAIDMDMLRSLRKDGVGIPQFNPPVDEWGT